MLTTIIKNRPILYPLSGKDLEEGQIYEGSDGRLYVGVGLLYLADGTKLSAVGVGNDYYAYEDLGDDAIFFRAINVILTVND